MERDLYFHPVEPERHYDVRALLFCVVAFLFCQIPVMSIMVGSIGIVYCKKAKKQRGNHRWMWITAIVFGIMGILGSIVSTIYCASSIYHIFLMIYSDAKMIPLPEIDPVDFKTPMQPAVCQAHIQ